MRSATAACASYPFGSSTASPARASVRSRSRGRSWTRPRSSTGCASCGRTSASAGFSGRARARRRAPARRRRLRRPDVRRAARLPVARGWRRTGRGARSPCSRPAPGPAGNWVSAAVPYFARPDVAAVVVPTSRRPTPRCASGPPRRCSSRGSAAVRAAPVLPRQRPCRSDYAADSVVVRRDDWEDALAAASPRPARRVARPPRPTHRLHPRTRWSSRRPAPLFGPHLRDTLRHAEARGAAARETRGRSLSWRRRRLAAPGRCGARRGLPRGRRVGAGARDRARGRGCVMCGRRGCRRARGAAVSVRARRAARGPRARADTGGLRRRLRAGACPGRSARTLARRLDSELGDEVAEQHVPVETARIVERRRAPTAPCCRIRESALDGAARAPASSSTSSAPAFAASSAALGGTSVRTMGRPAPTYAFNFPGSAKRVNEPGSAR